ncbi:proton-dependent oligopeptide transporter, POT family [Salinimicrobium catena]|uniref:Proton-dependent oligopeptide transporter, POT family n=1 Tax=Salinimicrobium catena TaxID=390640 RepID=A0A1H5JYU2_9FLAO|nr:peptide MFS transporter [Salinimicrobium catena]SDK91723.1 proton-dependent oligopeptide transporter, POT family [Salinimicrobium catena]SEE57397.1 proton-dependent oligopeptide transporter, POT family [Salinimicrobium catena]
MATTATPATKKELFGHPVGLYVLFFTEMWERFSYYGMRAILVLYLVSATQGGNAGLGWTNAEALALYGWYTMLVYVASIPGGIIADKLLGQKKTVLVGGIVLVAGHGILAVEEMWAFYSGLALIIAGVGMLKPNISTMVGGLYKEGDIRRDKGFTIFYIGINLGAFLSSLIVGYVGENIGWHWGFGLAGIAMALGLLVYLWGQKYLRNVGNLLSKEERDQGASFGGMFKDLFKSPLQLAITGVLMAFSIYWLVMQDIAYGFLFIFLTLVTAMMLMVYKDLTSQVMKDRYVVMLLSFILVIVFWGAFEQAGGLMNIYALEKTNRSLPFSLPLIGNEVPASWFQSLNAMFIIIFGVIVANFWAKRKLKNKEASSIFKMAIGVIIMGLGFVFMVFASMQFQSNGASAMYWLVLAYLFHTIGELSSSPVALSFITKLAPVKYASLMMGVYFAATGLGNKVAGIVGELSSEAGDQTIFLGITIFTVAFATIVLLMLKPLKRLTHGVEDEERELPEQENFELGNEDIVDKEEYKRKK